MSGSVTFTGVDLVEQVSYGKSKLYYWLNGLIGDLRPVHESISLILLVRISVNWLVTTGVLTRGGSVTLSLGVCSHVLEEVIIFEYKELPLSCFYSYSSISSLNDYSTMVLAKPKSQILTKQFASTRMFAGLISLCIKFAECRKFMQHRILYNKYLAWSSSN